MRLAERVGTHPTCTDGHRGIEPGQRIRIDSTVTDSPIRAPSDSHLLLDGLRVLMRLLKQARELPEAPMLSFVNHHRVAKKRADALWCARSAAKREPLYRDLLAATGATLESIDRVREQLLSHAACSVERLA
ncbi:MAG: IS5 family transposase [Gammaproteobacteria bacterium]|jgi:IS5 family transposase